jgi:hypothetical protein
MPPQEGLSTAGTGELSPRGPSSAGLSTSTSSDGLPAIEEKQAKRDNGETDVNKDDDREQAKDMDFDELLPHVGEFGTYQKILFVLMIPFAFFVAWVYFSQIFITLVPEQYWCRVPELENLTIDER